MRARRSYQVSVAQAKKSLSELLGRVAYRQESVTILKRGRPMARLVPVSDTTRSPLADVKGWLDKNDPFFSIMEAILAARHARRPRRPPSLKN
jgi:prevent-host-death family protein